MIIFSNISFQKTSLLIRARAFVFQKTGHSCNHKASLAGIRVPWQQHSMHASPDKQRLHEMWTVLRGLQRGLHHFVLDPGAILRPDNSHMVQTAASEPLDR